MKRIQVMIAVNKLDYMSYMDATPTNQAITRLMHEMDEAVIELEAKWGIGRLWELCPVPLKVKWDVQLDKLDKALHDKDLDTAIELVQGSMRGLIALEAAVEKEGHRVIDPEVWWVEVDGKTVGVTRSFREVRNAVKQDCPVYTIGELVRTLNAVKAGIFEKDIKVPVPIKEFDFEKGDEVPF